MGKLKGLFSRQVLQDVRILCSHCFHQIIDAKENIATCSYCGKKYDIAESSPYFRVLLPGGHIKNNLSYDDVINFIKKGDILANDYIASPTGPWISIYSSPFEKCFKGEKIKNNKSSIALYKRKKRRISIITTLSFLLMISIAINFALVILVYFMNNKISSLIEKITG